MPDRPSTTLRRMLEGPEIVVLPGAYDALSARLAERAGFDAMFTTGFGFSASVLGQPDFGLLTMSETMDRVRHVVRAVNVPVVADMDTGYGNPLNVRRTVQEVVAAGGRRKEDPRQCCGGKQCSNIVLDVHGGLHRNAACVFARQPSSAARRPIAGIQMPNENSGGGDVTPDG